ncbi:MAG: carboxypeptidase-like regulatory domain-containing protein, partial [Bacteroidetes bacterium]|nr:carboxypeptidase-like regulatory domain-containing protein [Bacteroidota bacterium]
MHRYLVLFLAVVCLTGTAPRLSVAQHHFEGTVVDSATGEGLPGASLQIEGTYSGTITSASGTFALRSDQPNPVLIIRFIGYETARVIVADDGRPVRIALRASAISLPGITVTGEDPAVRIMRRVIEEKQRWRAELLTYSVEAYNRFRMEND